MVWRRLRSAPSVLIARILPRFRLAEPRLRVAGNALYGRPRTPDQAHHCEPRWPAVAARTAAARLTKSWSLLTRHSVRATLGDPEQVGSVGVVFACSACSKRARLRAYELVVIAEGWHGCPRAPRLSPHRTRASAGAFRTTARRSQPGSVASSVVRCRHRWHLPACGSPVPAKASSTAANSESSPAMSSYSTQCRSPSTRIGEPCR